MQAVNSCSRCDAREGDGRSSVERGMQPNHVFPLVQSAEKETPPELQWKGRPGRSAQQFPYPSIERSGAPAASLLNP